jgi:hypothetical protein
MLDFGAGLFARAVAGMDSLPTSTLAQRGEFDGVAGLCERLAVAKTAVVFAV